MTRVLLDAVWRAEHNIHPAGGCIPSFPVWRAEVCNRIGDTLIMLVAEFVFFRVGSRVAAEPEFFDEGGASLLAG